MKIPTGAQFENPPPGSHLARCYEIIDLGTQDKVDFKTQEKYTQQEIRIGWELPMELMAGLYKPELAGAPFSVWMTVKKSLNPKARLYKLISGWFGVNLSNEQAEDFDIQSLLGQPCMLSLIQNEEYINIASAGMIPRGTVMPDAWNPIRFFDMTPENFDQKVLESLPDGLKKKIMATPEYAILMGQNQPVRQSQRAPAPLQRLVNQLEQAAPAPRPLHLGAARPGIVNRPAPAPIARAADGRPLHSQPYGAPGTPQVTRPASARQVGAPARPDPFSPPPITDEYIDAEAAAQADQDGGGVSPGAI